MSLLPRSAGRPLHISTLGGEVDDARAADLLRPLFNGLEAGQMLEVARQAFEVVLKKRGLAMSTVVLEPAILYSRSMMDRQIRFEVVRPCPVSDMESAEVYDDGAPRSATAEREEAPAEVLMQGCIRLLGRLACQNAPHQCTVVVQVMLGEEGTSTYFPYQSQPRSWQIRESHPNLLIGRGDYPGVLTNRWPAAMKAISRFLWNPDSESLLSDALRPEGQSLWQRMSSRKSFEPAYA